MTVLENIKIKIKPYIDNGKKDEAIKRLFQFDNCYAFRGIEDRGFELLQSISKNFNVPLRSLYIVGSAQLGYSFMKSTEFSPGASDLDIAIVNTTMFLEYSELCYRITNKYRNRTGFTRHGELAPPEVAKRFSQYLNKGYLRPDYMPACQEKESWLSFFERIGDDYLDVFKKVTCGIYVSETFFLSKQEDIITKIVGKP